MLMLLEICPGCGQQVAAENVPGGLCPECLLRQGAELVETAEYALLNTPSDTQPRFEPPDPLELEADLPGYDVYQLLGRGGMGAVYKARHRGLDRIVALKILPRSSGEQQFSERFERKARALARLNHENIVMAFDFGVTERYAYCVMEFLDGPNLRELMQLEGVDCNRALHIVRDVCRGLAYAHESGVVHRDIKPENVLVGFDGQVKIADFGLAKLIAAHDTDLTLTFTRHFMGTVHYMAPEQVERPRQVDQRADIYSTGVLLYEMLTSELPLGRFEDPSALTSVNSSFDSLVLKALEKVPARRYQSAEEFGRQCETLLENANDESKPSPSSGDSRKRNRRRVLIAGGLFSFVGLVLLGWQLVLDFNKDKEGNFKLSIKASGDDGKAEKPKADRPVELIEQHWHKSLWDIRGHEQLQKQFCGDCHTPQSLGVKPTEDATKTEQQTAEALAKKIDELILQKMQQVPKAADDAEFIRRVWLDVLGAVPPKEEIEKFVDSDDPQKREKLLYEKWLKSHRAAQQPKGDPRRTTPNDAFDKWLFDLINGNARKQPAVDQESENEEELSPGEDSKSWSRPPVSWKRPADVSEGLPIVIKSVQQLGEFPAKRLALRLEVPSMLAEEAEYYLMLVGPHTGSHELAISLTFPYRGGELIPTPLPKISDGEPLDVYFEMVRSDKQRVRASNTQTVVIIDAGAPKTDIRYSEKLLSPFKAIHWEEDTPQVQIGDRWYELLAIHDLSVADIMSQAKASYPDDPKRAFEQNLLEVVGHLRRILPETFGLTIRELPDGEETTTGGFKLNGRERAITQKIKLQLQPSEKIQ